MSKAEIYIGIHSGLSIAVRLGVGGVRDSSRVFLKLQGRWALFRLARFRVV
jgi:hypothetical protein